MNLTTLRELLVDELKDLYSAETQLVKALPRMAKHATTVALKNAIQNHLEETREQVHRLEKAGELLECKKLTGKKCKGMVGLLNEGKELLAAKGEDSIIDAAIVAASQRVEHYEIAAYGTARTLAELLGQQEIVALLQQNLDEEKSADKMLTEIVELEVYPMVTDQNGSARSGNGRYEKEPAKEREPVGAMR